VLELGPLEGGHAYTLEHYGAEVLSIEANAEAYLKCLVAKEILGMRSRFLLGDFMAYLRENEAAFDLIFASGVLYHMVRPLELIYLICRRGARALIWTHYYDPARAAEFLAPRTVDHAGVSALHHPKPYSDRGDGQFWGGLETSACWLGRDDILAAFRAYGHTRVEVVDEQPDAIGGPSFTLITSR
jgi:SAM-dependent methyltransferase